MGAVCTRVGSGVSGSEEIGKAHVKALKGKGTKGKGYSRLTLLPDDATDLDQAKEQRQHEAETGTGPAPMSDRLSEAPRGAQMKLCDECSNWMNQCRCRPASAADEDDGMGLMMSRGGKKTKARKTMSDIRRAAAEREDRAALEYNLSSSAGNQMATPAGKAPIPRNPKGENLAPLKPGLKTRANLDGKKKGKGEDHSGAGSRKGPMPGAFHADVSASSYQRPRTPPGGWASVAPRVSTLTRQKEAVGDGEEEDY